MHNTHTYIPGGSLHINYNPANPTTYYAIPCHNVLLIRMTTKGVIAVVCR